MHILGITKTKKNITKKSPSKPKSKTVTEKVAKPKTETVPTLTSNQTQETVNKAPVRRPSIQQTSKAVLPNTSQNINHNLITVVAPSKSTSLLLSNNLPKQQTQEIIPTTIIEKQQQSAENTVNSSAMVDENISSEDKEVNEAIQAFMQSRVSSPTIKAGMYL